MEFISANGILYVSRDNWETYRKATARDWLFNLDKAIAAELSAEQSDRAEFTRALVS